MQHSCSGRRSGGAWGRAGRPTDDLETQPGLAEADRSRRPMGPP
jgi:hypothetical protein